MCTQFLFAARCAQSAHRRKRSQTVRRNFWELRIFACKPAANTSAAVLRTIIDTRGLMMKLLITAHARERAGFASILSQESIDCAPAAQCIATAKTSCDVFACNLSKTSNNNVSYKAETRTQCTDACPQYCCHRDIERVCKNPTTDSKSLA